MRSFRKTTDRRRKIYLSLAGSIETQLREAFAKRSDAGVETQTSLGAKLGVGKSVINRRLTGKQNMTIETIAEMVWALDQCIDVKIFDPADQPQINHPLSPPDRPEMLDVSDISARRAKSSSRPIKSRIEMAI